MPLNPFTELPKDERGQPIRPRSLFDENPFDPSQGIDVNDVKKLNDEYDKMPREYLGVLMNYETRVFFESLVRQLGEEGVKEVLGRANTKIKNGELLKLDCSFCPNLKELKDLPPSLKELYCNDCPITELNNLPPSLKELYCNDCPITELNNLPPSLTVLDCSFCPNLKELKDLPPSLTRLYCYRCPFTENPTEYAALKAKYPQIKFV